MAYDSPAGLIAMSVIFEVFAIGMVLLRFMSRRKMRAGFRTDDWLICVALLLGTGLFIVEVYGVAVEAFGYPLTKGTRTKTERYYSGIELQFAFLLLNTIGITMIKLSAVFLYRRIFTTKGLFGAFSLGWIIFLLVWGLTFTLWLVFQCGSHPSAFYGPYEQYLKYCSKNNKAGYALVYTDLLTDLITVVMPLPIVVKLHTSFGRKIAIVAVFAIGIFSVACSATRAGIYTHSQQKNGEDILIMMTSLSVWTYLEVMVGICAACAITIRPVFAELNFSLHPSRLSVVRESFSGIFSRRSSMVKTSGISSEETLRMSHAHEKGIAVDVESTASNESIQRPTEQRQPAVERGYNVPGTDTKHEKINDVEADAAAPSNF